MSRAWEVRAVDPHLEGALAAALDLSPLIARILVARGITEPDAARRFLHPELKALNSPDGLPDLDAAVDRVLRAMRDTERITVFGDYDVDGTTATAILVEFLGGLGATIDYYIPDRIREGYGLTLGGVEAVAARGTRLLITADCGTSSIAEIARARQLGMEVIVIDHHQTPKERPDTVALLNPHRHDSTFGDRDLCSAGLAFYLVGGIRRRMRAEGAFHAGQEPDLRGLLDLVALGTVADVSPLVGLNRILVHHGLTTLAQSGRPGLAALKAVGGVGPGPVTAGSIGFRLAPRLNAAGRLGDAARAVELLLCADPERATTLARELDEENTRRREIEREVTEDAIVQALADPDQAEAPAVVVAGESWHPGVIGIVAARLVERFRRPAVVISLLDGVGKGSARTSGSVHLYQAFQECTEHLRQFGGHAAAAGLTIDASQVGAFRKRFREVVGGLDPEIRQSRRIVDSELNVDQVSISLGEDLSRLAPFGAGNPEPVFVAHAAVVKEARVVGKDHLRLRFEKVDAAAIGFGMAEHLPDRGARVDLCYSVRLSEWQGRQRAEIHLREAPRPT